MAHDRLRDLARRVSPSSSGSGSVHTSWCCTATSGIGTPGHRADGRTPDPGADQHALALDVPRVRLGRRARGRRGCRSPSPVRRPRTRRPVRLGLAPERGHDPHGLAVPRPWAPSRRRGCVEASSSGLLAAASVGREELRALDAVRTREPLPALELLHPFRGRGHLEPADAVPAAFAVAGRRRRRARRCPARSDTSCGSRSSGRRSRARARWIRPSRTGGPGRARARR